jgi:hypothetical protein
MRNCPNAGTIALKLAGLEAVPIIRVETKRAEGKGDLSAPALIVKNPETI